MVHANPFVVCLLLLSAATTCSSFVSHMGNIYKIQKKKLSGDKDLGDLDCGNFFTFCLQFFSSPARD